jgi:hypothetical protein
MRWGMKETNEIAGKGAAGKGRGAAMHLGNTLTQVRRPSTYTPARVHGSRAVPSPTRPASAASAQLRRRL